MWLFVASSWAAADAAALAARVATTCGNPYLTQEIRFTMVVEKDGVEKARRTHIWRPREGSVRVSWQEHEVFLEQIWPAVASTAPPELAIEAYSWFINDSYWLLAPCKVLDPGVKLGLDAAGRLTLAFEEGTGITPGDRYTLTVDAQDRVSHWDFVLESGVTGSFDWTGYGMYGPLELAAERRSADGVVIRFEGVEVK